MNTDCVGDTPHINQKVAGLAATGAGNAAGAALKCPRAAAHATATKRSGAAQGVRVTKRPDVARRSGGKRF